MGNRAGRSDDAAAEDDAPRYCGSKLPWRRAGSSTGFRVFSQTSSFLPDEDPLCSQVAGGHGRIERADVRRDFQLRSQVLGTGMSGAVCMAEHRATRKRVAVKQFRLRRLRATELRLLEEEVSVFLQLDHPNICRLLHVYEQSKQVWLVMELCRCELFAKLQEHGQYSEAEAAEAMEQMLRAVNYLHRHNIVHRDLKLENWMCGDTEQGDRLKLIDFGFSQRLKDASEELHLACGTLPYLSPERLRQCYSSRSDIWSLGVICYELLFARPPFHSSSDRKIAKQILHSDFPRPSRWSHLSAECRSFVKSLLCKDPARRPDAADALQHPWLRAARGSSISLSSATLSVVGSLRVFARGSHLQRAGLTLLAHSLSSQEREALEAVFLDVDSSGRGTITFAELSAALRQACPDIVDEELQHIFRWLDVFREDGIHCTPFIAALLPSHVKEFEARAHDAFKAFDAAGNGYITADALMQGFAEKSDMSGVPLRSTFVKMQDTCRRSLRGMTRLEAEQWINEADYAGTGAIDFSGFLVALTGKSRARAALEDVADLPLVKLDSRAAARSDADGLSPCRWSDDDGVDFFDEDADFGSDQQPQALGRSQSLGPGLGAPLGLLRVRSVACAVEEDYFAIRPCTSLQLPLRAS